MPQSAVDKIIGQIHRLTSAQRRQLDRRLAADADRQWEAAAIKARQQAKARGVDQKAIDRAVKESRYGA
ncbi:MAG: hypothetical protein WD768_07900 [Phycisphaeraceae bacterium]